MNCIFNTILVCISSSVYSLNVLGTLIKKDKTHNSGVGIHVLHIKVQGLIPWSHWSAPKYLTCTNRIETNRGSWRAVQHKGLVYYSEACSRPVPSGQQYLFTLRTTVYTEMLVSSELSMFVVCTFCVSRISVLPFWNWPKATDSRLKIQQQSRSIKMR